VTGHIGGDRPQDPAEPLDSSVPDDDRRRVECFGLAAQRIGRVATDHLGRDIVVRHGSDDVAQEVCDGRDPVGMVGVGTEGDVDRAARHDRHDRGDDVETGAERLGDLGGAPGRACEVSERPTPTTMTGFIVGLLVVRRCGETIGTTARRTTARRTTDRRRTAPCLHARSA
jgi:hypothetical protein